MPRRSSWRVAQFDTLRLRLVKTAARVVEMKSKIKIHLPTSAPDQAVGPQPPAAADQMNTGAGRPAFTRSPQPPAHHAPSAANSGQTRHAWTQPEDDATSASGKAKVP